MRRSSITMIFLTVALLALCMFTVGAAENPITVSIELDQTSMTGPGNVNVTLRVSNAGDAAETVQLFDPANKAVTSFGDGGSMVIVAGETREWTGVWPVTSAQLSAGSLAYTVKCKVADETGSLHDESRLAVASLSYESERIELDVSRSVAPLARKNATFNVVYTLRNLGNVAIEDITVKESKDISTTAQTVSSLAPGASIDVTFAVKMGTKALTSSGSVTYKPTGATKTESLSVGKATINVANPALSFAVKADKTSVQIGEDITLTFTLNNAGNVVYENVVITDPVLGNVFENQTIAAGTAAEPTVLTLTYVVRMNKKYSFQFVMEGDDNTGGRASLPANNGDELVAVAIDPTQVMLLTVTATPESYVIDDAPADMSFTFHVTNASTVDASSVNLTHAGVSIYTIPTLDAGQSITFKRDFSLFKAGKYQFTLACKNQMGEDVSFVSDPVIVGYSSPEAAVTAAPTVYIPIPTAVTSATENNLSRTTRSVLMTLALVFGIITAILLVLVFIGGAARRKRIRMSKNAMDHMDLGMRRNYQGEDENDTSVANLSKEDESAGDVPMPHERYMKDVPHDVPQQEEDGMSDTDDAALPSPDVDYASVYVQNEQDTAYDEEPITQEEHAAVLSGGTGSYRLHRDGPVAETTENENKPRTRAQRRVDVRETEGLDE